MPVDTSIYAPLIKRVDPAEQANQYASFANAMANNRLLQNENQQYQAKVGAGKLLSQAVGPNGQFDSGKYNALIAKNPDLAPYAAEALSNSNNLSLGQSQAGSAAQTLSQDKVKAFQSHLGLFSQILAPLATADAPTKQDAYKAASKLISNPDLDPETRQQLVGDTVQFLGDLPDDPNQIKQRIKGLQLTVQDAQTRLGAITGQTGLVSNGSEQFPVTTNNYTGSVTQGNGQPIPMKLSPEGRAQQVPAVGPSGEPGSVPLGTRVDDYGRPIGAQPSSAQPQPSAPASSGGPAGFNPTGLAPGTASTAEQSATMASQAHAFAQEAPMRRGLIQNLRDESNQFQGGPLEPFFTKVKQFAAQFHVPGVDPNEAAGPENFRKLVGQVVQSQGQTLGHTNMQTELGLESNPSLVMSKEGRNRVLALMSGNEDAIQGRDAIWQGLVSSGKAQPRDWQKFTTDFNKRFDPRAFQFQYMTPDQQQLLLKGMSKDERTKFEQSQHFAQWVRGQAGQ